MKTLVMGLALSLVGVVHADFRSTKEAEQAVRAYNDLAVRAQEAGDRAYPRNVRFGERNYRDMKEVMAYDEISNLATELASELHRQIVRPLRAGASEFRLDRHLDRAERDRTELQRAVRDLGRSLDTEVEKAARHADRQWDELDRSLNSGGGRHRRPGHGGHPGGRPGPGPGPGPGPRPRW